MQEILKLSAVKMAKLIATRELSSKEVVQAHLARIAQVNPKLNAVTQVFENQAMEAAEKADKAVKSGAALAPLHGVPITVKCNIDMRGVPSTWGVRAFENSIAAEDAPLIEHVRAAGAVPIARTNCPDFGMRLHTDSALHGLTRNPWSFDRTASGSSGGEAAAIASGMSPLGIGNDIGGSLRNPASACGIASIRPSAGRVPDASGAPFDNRPIAWQWMAVHGPMARNVADVRLGLKAMMGAHPRDPLALGMPFEGQVQRKINVAVIASPPGGACAPVVVQAVQRAAKALSSAGYELVEVTPPDYEEVLATYLSLLGSDYFSAWKEMEELTSEGGRRFFNFFLSKIKNRAETPAEFSAVMKARDGLARKWSVFMDEYPLILSPTWRQLPFINGSDETEEGAAIASEMFGPVTPANLLGLPSACVPASFDSESGMPIGVLLTGRRFRDDQCLDAAEVVESIGAVQTPIEPAW